MHKGKNLAGTCGIPLERDRVYIRVDCAARGANDDVDVPKRIIWPDGRSWPVRSTARHTTYGRAIFGNLVERFDIFMGQAGNIKTLWCQDGSWFVAKPTTQISAAPHA